MKKTSKYIIITLAILLVLGGAFAALYFTDPARAEEEEESSSSATDIALYTREKPEVSKVSYKNSAGEYTLVQTVTTETPEPSSEASDSGSSQEPVTTYDYAFEGYEQYATKKTDLEGAARNISGLSATKDLGEISDLKPYGLEGEDATTVTVKFTDGSQETFVAGIEGGETTGRYILYNGRVYIGYVNELFFKNQYDYFEPFTYQTEDVTEGEGEAANTRALLYDLELTGTHYPEPIRLGFDDTLGELRMTAPIQSATHITNMEGLVTALKAFSAQSVVLANATEADLEQYGLKTPFATASFEVNDQKHTLSVSEQKVDGKRYLIADGDTSIIYTANVDDVAPWAEADVTSLRSSYVFLPVVMTVDEFTIEANGKTHVIDLSRTKNEEKSSDTQTVYDYAAKLDGTEIDYERIPKFYSSMISIAVLNNEQLEYEESPEVTFTFKYYEGGQDTVTYHRATEDRLIAKINGEYTATIRRSSIDEFLAALAAFVAGEDVAS